MLGHRFSLILLVPSLKNNVSGVVVLREGIFLFIYSCELAQLALNVKWCSTTLATSLQKRVSPADIVYLLSMPGASQQHMDVLTQTLQDVDYSSTFFSTADVIGVTADILKYV